jgi:hypothetical protein
MPSARVGAWPASPKSPPSADRTGTWPGRPSRTAIERETMRRPPDPADSVSFEPWLVAWMDSEQIAPLSAHAGDRR